METIKIETKIRKEIYVTKLRKERICNHLMLKPKGAIKK